MKAACNAAPSADSVECDSENRFGNSSSSCMIRLRFSFRFTSRSLGLGRKMSGKKNQDSFSGRSRKYVEIHGTALVATIVKLVKLLQETECQGGSK